MFTPRVEFVHTETEVPWEHAGNKSIDIEESTIVAVLNDDRIYDKAKGRDEDQLSDHVQWTISSDYYNFRLNSEGIDDLIELLKKLK